MSNTTPRREWSLPEITDADVAAAASRTSLAIDAERAAILREMSSVDVRACPGSGKTTLLVAKLGILAEKWKLRTRGICVLSHTNVAKHEIQRRFHEYPALQQLNSYPHFVGTIQSFIDRFLGCPGAAIFFGMRPRVIENDRFRMEAYNECFSNSAYRKLKGAITLALQNDPNRSVADFIGELEFCDEDLSLPPMPTKNKPWGAESDSYKQVRQLKAALAKRGYYRFGDMDCLAGKYLTHCAKVAESLTARFPIVFLDESQDTSIRQASILQRAFTGSVVQRVGDDRQAIYSDPDLGDNENDGVSFPGPVVLSMPKSFRVGPRVAALIQNLCCCATPEQIEGNAIRTEGDHTVFLFSHATIGRVLPCFAELVASEIGGGLPADAVRAVGAVQKGRGQSDKLPYSVRDYWEEFSPANAGRAPSRCVGEHLSDAAWLVQTRQDPGKAAKRIVEAIIRVLRLDRISDDQIDLRPASFLGSLEATRPKVALELRQAISRLCHNLANTQHPLTMDALKEVESTVSEIMPSKWHSDAKLFWKLSVEGARHVVDSRAANLTIFEHPTSSGTIRVRVDTIHSVKGETLQAVLVLDTFNYCFHLANLLEKGLLVGRRPQGTIGSRLARHTRLAFVAASRPTNLLCLALHEDHVSEANRQLLESLGWRVTAVK